VATIEELIFRVTADTAKMGNPLAPFQRDIEHTRTELGGLQKQVDDLDGESIEVDVKLKNAQALALARENIARLREEVAEQFIIDPTVDTRKAERTIKALQTKINALTIPKAPKEQIDPLLENLQTLAARSGIQVVSFLAKGITAAGSTGGPIIAVALAGVIMAALSMAGGIIAASGGFAGLTLGIIGALQDPAIALAATGTLDDIKRAFIGTGDELKAPFLSAFAEIGQSIKDTLNAAGPDFDRLGGVIDELGSKISEMFRELGPGISSALRVAGPVLTELAAALPALGQNISAFFIMLDANSRGAALSMKLLMLAINSTVASFTMTLGWVLQWFTIAGVVIDFLDREFMKMESNLRKMVVFLGGGLPFALAHALRDTGDAAGESTQKIKLVADANEKAAAAAQKLAVDNAKLAAEFEKVRAAAEAAAREVFNFFNDSLGAAMGMDQSLISIENGWLSLWAALEEGPRTLDLRQQAGRDNAQAILDQLGLIKQQRDAMLAVGGDLFAVNQTFAENVSLVRKDAEALGFAGQELDNLLTKYENLPAQQIIEIQTAWATNDNPDVMYAELVKQFGEPVVAKILAEVELDTTKAKKDFFGLAFGDAEQERNVIKIDPEGFETLKGQLDSMVDDPKTVTVNVTSKRDATFMTRSRRGTHPSRPLTC
jgi:hypothetical protein